MRPVKIKGKLWKKDKKDKNACERERGLRKRERTRKQMWRDGGKKKRLKLVRNNDERKN